MNNTILIIAHAPLASALRSAALHVFPEVSADVVALDVLATQDPQMTLTQARQAVQGLVKHCEGAGTLLMSDILGATPCNIAKQLMDTVQVKCVAGVSLPMLLRAITYRAETLDVMAQKALQGAITGALEVT